MRVATGVLVAGGCVLTGWLYWSSPEVDLDGPGERGEVTLSCTALGRLYPDGRATYRVPGDDLTLAQADYVDDYLSGEGSDGLDDTDRRDRLAASVRAACDDARTNRQTGLGLVAVTTGVVAVVRGPPGRDRRTAG